MQPATGVAIITLNRSLAALPLFTNIGFRTAASSFSTLALKGSYSFAAMAEIVLGKDRCASPWAKADLQVPGKRRMRRIAGSRPRPHAPAARNSVWCYDFVFDACANGQQLKCLALVDEYPRECPAIDVAGSIRSRRVIDVLSRLINVHGAPRYIRSDNGPEFVSTALLKWALEQRIETAFIGSGCSLKWQAVIDLS